MVLVPGAEKAGDHSCFFCAFFAIAKIFGHMKSRDEKLE